MWWKINRSVSNLFSIVISLIFISHGGDRLIQMTLNQTEEFSIFNYMHSVETIVIGFFLLLVECNSPLFRKNVNIMFRPTPKTIMIMVFSIFLYTGRPRSMDFYLVFGMGFVMLVLSFYTKKPTVSLESN